MGAGGTVRVRAASQSFKHLIHLLLPIGRFEGSRIMKPSQRTNACKASCQNKSYLKTEWRQERVHEYIPCLVIVIVFCN